MREFTIHEYYQSQGSTSSNLPRTLGVLQTEDGGDAEALSKLFCRIDANCDGTIDWDEFSSYMVRCVVFCL